MNPLQPGAMRGDDAAGLKKQIPSSKPLEERVDSSTDADRRYLWGARSEHRDDLVLRDRDTTGNGSLDERLYATMDFFNGTAIIDTNGNVKERYGYSTFGVRRIMAPDFTDRVTSAFDWDFGFQGQFLDTETGYINYGFRYYSPQIGRFISRDPIEEEGGLNLYEFVENNAVNWVDLFGNGKSGGGGSQIEFQDYDDADLQKEYDDLGKNRDKDSKKRRQKVKQEQKNRRTRNPNKQRGGGKTKTPGVVVAAALDMALQSEGYYSPFTWDFWKGLFGFEDNPYRETPATCNELCAGCWECSCPSFEWTLGATPPAGECESGFASDGEPAVNCYQINLV